MTQTAPILRLADLDHASQDFIGETAYRLSSLSKRNIPIPDIYLISQAQVQQILESNQIPTKLKQLLEITKPCDIDTWRDLSGQVGLWIKKAAIPDQLARELIWFYNQQFDQKRVAVSLSAINKNVSEKISTCQGDSNFILTILETIANGFGPSYLKQLVSSNPNAIAPGAVMFFAYHPLSSGLAFSRHPQSGDKHKIVINAGINDAHLSHSYSQNYEYNLTDQTIDSSATNKQLISKELLTKLSSIVQKIKQQQLEHLIIEWIVDHDQPQIINYYPDTLTDQLAQNQGQLMVKTLVPGSAFGTLINLNKSQYLAPKSLLTLDHISHHNINQITNAQGLILQKPPTQLIVQILKEKQIPTVVVDRLPTNFINRRIHLNADQNYIKFFDQISPQVKPKKLKLFTQTTDDLLQYQEYLNLTDGIFVDSDLIWQHIGVHPQHLIEKNQTESYYKTAQAFIDNLNKKTNRPILYRSFTFKQHIVSKLKQNKKYQLDPNLNVEGSAHFLHFPQLLEQELNIIDKLNQHSFAPIALVINGLNSITDWQLISYHISQFNKKIATPIEVWLEIDKPAMIIELNQVEHCQGVIIDVEAITKHLFGLNNQQLDLTPDSDVTGKFILNHLSTQHYMPILVNLDKHQKNLIEQLQDKVVGVIVPPRLIGIIKNNY